MARPRAPSRPRPGRVRARRAALLLAGCGQSEDKADEESPTEVMEQAKKQFDDASSVHIALSTDSVPTSGDGVLGATATSPTTPPFEGDVKVLFSGIPADAAGHRGRRQGLRQAAVLDQVRGHRPGGVRRPDPADFADPENGLSSLLTQLEDLKKGKETQRATRS